MADFNFIVTQVNANANPIGTLTAPAGTAMPFQQAVAPLGWVGQITTAYNDAILRVINPSQFSNTGGSLGASGFIIGPYSVDGHALTVAELAAHNHVDAGHLHGLTDPGHQHTVNSSPGVGTSAGGPNTIQQSAGTMNTTVSTTGITVQLNAASIQNTGSGTAHVHTHTPNVKFVDHIVAVKS
jgi:hypothetical protein